MGTECTVFHLPSDIMLVKVILKRPCIDTYAKLSKCYACGPISLSAPGHHESKLLVSVASDDNSAKPFLLSHDSSMKGVGHS